MAPTSALDPFQFTLVLINFSINNLLGGFPDEAKVAAGLVQFDAIAYAYLVVIVGCTIGAACFQFKNKQREDDERDEANPQNIYKNMMDTGY